MRFLVRLGYGLAAVGFGYLAYAALQGAPPFDERPTRDLGEAVRFAILLAVNSVLLFAFALRPGVWARIVAPVLAAAWLYLGYVMWSGGRDMAGVVTQAVLNRLGDGALTAEDLATPDLLTSVAVLSLIAVAAALLDWMRAIVGGMFSGGRAATA